MGTNQYPRNRAKMHVAIFHWRNRAARYGLHALPSDILFVQDNNNKSTNGEKYANDGQKYPQVP